MAEKEDGGILAIVAGGKPKGGEGEKEKGGASSAKARALKAMHEAMQAGNWDEAAERAQDVYDECAMHSADADEESAEDATELDFGEN